MKVKIIFQDNTSQLINISRAILLDWKYSWTCWVNNKQYDIQATIQQPSTGLYELYVAEHRKADKPKDLEALLAQDLAEYDQQTSYKQDGLIRTNLFLQAQNDLAIKHFGIPLHQITSHNPPLFESIGLETSADSEQFYNIISDNTLIPYCKKYTYDTCPVFLESGFACSDDGSIFQAFDKTFDEASEVMQEIFIDELLCIVEAFDKNIEESIEALEKNKNK